MRRRGLLVGREVIARAIQVFNNVVDFFVRQRQTCLSMPVTVSSIVGRRGMVVARAGTSIPLVGTALAVGTDEVVSCYLDGIPLVLIPGAFRAVECSTARVVQRP